MTRLSELKKRLMIAAVVSAVLMGVFMLYLQPEFLRLVAEQVWACF